MKTNQQNRNPLLQAFSLIELLTVIALVAILAALIIPAFQSITTARSIESGADQIAGALGLARQTAVTKNKAVEVRFYDIPADGFATDFRAFQLFEISESGIPMPLTRVNYLRTPAIIVRDVNLSTLLDSSLTKTFTAQDPQSPLPGGNTTYPCRAFRFQPNGTTDLPISKKWHLTVIDPRQSRSGSAPPANFVTIWVEPATGTVKTLRP